MAKSSRKSKEAAGAEIKPAAPEAETRTGNGSAEAEKRATAKKPVKTAGKAKPAGKGRGLTPRRTAAPRKARGARTENSQTSQLAISDDEIRTRAYLISERRQQEGRPGDSAHDWLEARRQLQEEAAQRG